MEIVSDQTDLRKAVDNANEKVAYLNKIPTPVVAIDKDYQVIFMNLAGASALGKSPEDCVGQKCFNLFNTAHCNTQECRVAQAMLKNDVFTGDTIAKLPGGELPIRYTAAPLKDTQGTIIGGLEFVLDISKEMEITNAINELTAATIDGKLDIRADIDKYQGNNQQIVKAVNDLLDAIIKPLILAAEYIEGNPRPGDDADDVRWLNAEAINRLPVSPPTLMLLGEHLHFI